MTKNLRLFKPTLFFVIASIIFILFVGWISINKTIGDDRFSKIKSIIPERHQAFIKKYFFVDKFAKTLVDKYETKENEILTNILNSQITFIKKNPQEISEIRKNIIYNHILNEEQILIKNLKNKDQFLQKQFPEIINELNEIQFEIFLSEYYELKSHAILFKKLRPKSSA